MLSREYLRENAERLLSDTPERFANSGVERFIAVDTRRRAIVTRLEEKRRRRNELTAVRGRPEPEALAEMRSLKEDIRGLEEETERVEAELTSVERGIPNAPQDTVPRGADERANRVERSWGEPRKFDFEPAAHWDLGPALGVLDFERGAKLAGARFTVLRGAGARLSRALGAFMLDLQTREHGYEEIVPPLLNNAETLFGTGQLPKFEQDLFLTREGLYLIPTAEVPLTNLHRDEILDAEALPLKYTAFTPCFRAEAGAAGRDTRGFIRQHQFDKVEVVMLTAPESSGAALETLTGHAEEVLRRLELPYRVVSLCTADLGFASAKTYDLEVWLPGQNAYREISSCSNCESFQGRRANIRFRRATGARPEFVHTLNGSALAIGRTLVAVLENGQRADGSVEIPPALRPYMDGITEIRRPA
ncbi:MAG TPA: serine--tRNA ligase [Thermoanaerobaculia bacterium]|jgi:seryl-tRNA synthetase